jgi:hypothetical protein
MSLGYAGHINLGSTVRFFSTSKVSRSAMAANAFLYYLGAGGDLPRNSVARARS